MGTLDDRISPIWVGAGVESDYTRFNHILRKIHFCLWVYKYVYIYAGEYTVWVQMNVSVCGCVCGGQRTILGNLTQVLSSFYISDMGSSWKSPTRRGWLARESQGSTCL